MPKVTSVALTIYCKGPGEIEKEDMLTSAARWRVSPELCLESLASRRFDGLVDIATWWRPLRVLALLNVLLAGRQIYVTFSAQKFYRNHTKIAGIDWYTKGVWLADIVGEDSSLY